MSNVPEVLLFEDVVLDTDSESHRSIAGRLMVCRRLLCRPRVHLDTTVLVVLRDVVDGRGLECTAQTLRAFSDTECSEQLG